jgi:Fe(3+) dicitrate transport protein
MVFLQIIRKKASMRIPSFSIGFLALAIRPAWAEESGQPSPEAAAPEIVVVSTKGGSPDTRGAASVIGADDIERSAAFTVNEALRQAPGIFPRDEEGLGLRPNIGLRGLNPTRSSKVLLLEDGLPLTYAPYGDNASYSFPPIDRFERIEILKGASQVRFGPQTIAGVINFVTPRAPDVFGGAVKLAGGDEGYREAGLDLGGPIGAARALGHVNVIMSDGVRENTALFQTDLATKFDIDLSPNQTLGLRLARATENSQVTYSGLTTAEFNANPRGNIFLNDQFVTSRTSAALTHGWSFGDNKLTSALYLIHFDRDWWRQASNSGQRPNDASDPACGGVANLNTTCGNEGRLREYVTYGLDTRLSLGQTLEVGARFHEERQYRFQANGDFPTARGPGRGVNAGIREDSERFVTAVSGFAQATIDVGPVTIAPGARVEHIEFERVNDLTGARGSSDLTEWMPGLGVQVRLNDAVSVYGGAHRGFAPPRVEDIISAAGGVVDLDAELSRNYELGLRGRPIDGLAFDISAFRLAFENQIVPASVAGGVGAALTSAGATLHQGAEFSANGSLRNMGLLASHDFFFRTAVTYLPDAKYEGRRFSSVSGFSTVRVDANRLPYAPEWLASAAIGYAYGERFDVQLEVQHTGEMFSDDLNTIAPSADGQRGLIPDSTIFNIATHYSPPGSNTRFFVTVKNIADDLFIVDRARGVLPGFPRLVQAGVKARF